MKKRIWNLKEHNYYRGDTMDIIPVGNFYMFGIWRSRAYMDGWKAVDNVPGGWEFLKNADTQHPDFWTHPMLRSIEKNMKMISEHSRATFREMVEALVFIAQHSWEEYVEKYKDSETREK